MVSMLLHIELERYGRFVSYSGWLQFVDLNWSYCSCGLSVDGRSTSGLRRARLALHGAPGQQHSRAPPEKKKKKIAL